MPGSVKFIPSKSVGPSLVRSTMSTMPACWNVSARFERLSTWRNSSTDLAPGTRPRSRAPYLPTRGGGGIDEDAIARNEASMRGCHQACHRAGVPQQKPQDALRWFATFSAAQHAAVVVVLLLRELSTIQRLAVTSVEEGCPDHETTVEVGNQHLIFDDD